MATRKDLYGDRRLIRPIEPEDVDRLAADREAATEQTISKLYARPEGLVSETISISRIEPNPNNPRKEFEGLEQLVSSIQENGFISQILVRPSPTQFGKFQIVYGERRWRAAKEAGLKEIPCLIGEMSDDKVPIAALIENINRQELSPTEEANAYATLLEQRDARGKYRYSQDSLAKQLGVSRRRVIDKLKLLTAPQDVQEAIEHRTIGARMGGNLSKVSDPSDRAAILKAVEDKTVSSQQAASVIRAVATPKPQGTMPPLKQPPPLTAQTQANQTYSYQAERPKIDDVIKEVVSTNRPTEPANEKYKFDIDYARLHTMLNKWLAVIKDNPEEAGAALLYVTFLENDLGKLKQAIERAKGV